MIRSAFAAGICNNALPWLPCGGQEQTAQTVGNVISSLLGLSLIVAGLLTFGLLIVGGIQWITSGGDKAGLEAARNRIIHAIIGMILVASSWALTILVLNTFLGICFPNLQIPVIGQLGRGKDCTTKREPVIQPPGNGGSGGQPTDQTWYGCAQDKIITVSFDPNCVNGNKTYTYSCQPNGCTARSTGSCQIQNRGSGQCPSTCQWQATKPC